MAQLLFSTRTSLWIQFQFIEMNTQTSLHNANEDVTAGLRLKMATLWTSFMFLYIYVDYFALYMPGKMQGIQSGRVFTFNITQGFILAALASVTVPALMIFLSVALPANINRRTNTIIAAVYIPFTLFNLAGTVWMHMVFGAVVEVVLLCLIIRYARRLTS